MPEIEIRPAVPADLPVLAGLGHSYETQYVWQMDRAVEDGQTLVNFREVRLPRSVKVDYPYARTVLADEWGQQAVVLVAAIGSETVGYLRIKDRLIPNTAWVTDLVVKPQLRRQGIASGLILAGQDWSAQRGLRRFMIEMQSKNYPAICLARKLRFEFSGYHDHFYANQDIALFFSRFLR